MTRRTPWTPETASTASAASQPRAQATAQSLQELPPQPADNLPSPQATQDARVTQAYIPPTVEEDSEEALHLQHPDPETKARIEAEERRQEAKPLQNNKPVQSAPPHQAGDDSDDEDDNGGDLLDTLGDFLTGGPSDHASRAPNPLGFLDFLGEAFVAPFLGDKHWHDVASRNVSAPRAQPATEERPQGNFHRSSGDVKLEGDRYLVARCKNVAGQRVASRFDLNTCLMNDNGHFRWSTEGGFSHSARSIKVESGGEVLSAQLQTANGHWRSARVRLSDVITNGDGQLGYISQHQWPAA